MKHLNRWMEWHGGGFGRRLGLRLRPQTLFSFLLVLVLGSLTGSALADSGSRRTARISNVEGGAQVMLGTSTMFQQAYINMPLVEGTRLETSEDGRVEVQFDDGSIARITPNSSMSVNTLRLNSNGATVTDLELLSGLGYFELAPAAGERTATLRFGTNTVTAISNAVVRVNLDANPAELSVLAGDAHVVGGGQISLDIHANETARFDSGDPGRYFLTQEVAGDSWDQWNKDRDKELNEILDQQTTASAENGGEGNAARSELDAYGAWYAVPGVGNVWTPYGGGAGWDPFGYGYWGYYPGYGYMWISGYSWGWAPFHCGAWSYYASFGWGWFPGTCGGIWGGSYWQPTYVIVSGPAGYNPPARPHFGGRNATILPSGQKLIPVNQGDQIRPPALAIVGQKPRPVVVDGVTIQPITARVNPNRGTIVGRSLEEGQRTAEQRDSSGRLMYDAMGQPVVATPQGTGGRNGYGVGQGSGSGSSSSSGTGDGQSGTPARQSYAIDASRPGQVNGEQRYGRPATSDSLTPRNAPSTSQPPTPHSTPTANQPSTPRYTAPTTAPNGGHQPQYSAPPAPHYSPPAAASAPHYSPPPAPPASTSAPNKGK